MQSGEGQPFVQGPDMISQPSRHRRRPLLPPLVLTTLSQRSHRPAEVVAEVTELRRRPMHFPVLRERIRLAYLPAAAVAVRAVVPLHEARVHRSAHLTSVVVGGKRDEFIVEEFGVVAGEADVAGDGVAVDTGQAGGLAGADALGHMSEDGGSVGGREAGVEQGRALAFGETGLADGATQKSALVGAVTHGDGEVAVTTLAVLGAVWVEATEPAQVVHGQTPLIPGLPSVYPPLPTLTIEDGHDRKFIIQENNPLFRPFPVRNMSNSVIYFYLLC